MAAAQREPNETCTESIRSMFRFRRSLRATLVLLLLVVTSGVPLPQLHFHAVDFRSSDIQSIGLAYPEAPFWLLEHVALDHSSDSGKGADGEPRLHWHLTDLLDETLPVRAAACNDADGSYDQSVQELFAKSLSESVVFTSAPRSQIVRLEFAIDPFSDSSQRQLNQQFSAAADTSPPCFNTSLAGHETLLVWWNVWRC